jgi:hypothetical protein
MTFSDWVQVANGIITLALVWVLWKCLRRKREWMELTRDLRASVKDMRASYQEILGLTEEEVALIAGLSDELRRLFETPPDRWPPEALATLHRAMGRVVSALDSLALRLRRVLSLGDAE